MARSAPRRRPSGREQPGVLHFVATECGSQALDGADGILCGASNSQGHDEHHTFIVAGAPSRTGDAAYFELDDQSQGGDGLLAKVSVASGRARLVLKRGQTVCPYAEIHVDLPRRGRSSFTRGLEAVLGRRFRPG